MFKLYLKLLLKYLFTILVILTSSEEIYGQSTLQKSAVTEAKKLIKGKKYDDAIKILKQANEPQNAYVLDQLAIVLHLKKDFLEEVRALEIVKSMGKMSPAQYVRLGNAYSDINKKEQTVSNYREAIKIAPKYEKAYAGLYEFYLNEKNYSDARLIVIEIIDKFGIKKYWMNQYCRMEIEQTYFDNAKNVCQEAISRYPTTAENHVYLALAYKGTGDEAQARKILFNAAKRFPNSEETQWTAGVMSAELQNWELSNKHFSQCLKADKKSFRCSHELGKVKFELKDYEGALVNLKKACAFVKDVDIEIRKYSYELNKLKKTKISRKYEKEEGPCKSSWFGSMKKISQSGR